MDEITVEVENGIKDTETAEKLEDAIKEAVNQTINSTTRIRNHRTGNELTANPKGE